MVNRLLIPIALLSAFGSLGCKDLNTDLGRNLYERELEDLFTDAPTGVVGTTPDTHLVTFRENSFVSEPRAEYQSNEAQGVRLFREAAYRIGEARANTIEGMLAMKEAGASEKFLREMFPSREDWTVMYLEALHTSTDAFREELRSGPEHASNERIHELELELLRAELELMMLEESHAREVELKWEWSSEWEDHGEELWSGEWMVEEYDGWSECDEGDSSEGDCGMADCDMSDCDMAGCDMADCDMGDCDMSDCDMSDCDMGDCDMGDCDMSDCDMADCDMADCDMADCDMADCDMADCDMADCDMSDCDMSDCDMSESCEVDCTEGKSCEGKPACELESTCNPEAACDEASDQAKCTETLGTDDCAAMETSMGAVTSLTNVVFTDYALASFTEEEVSPAPTVVEIPPAHFGRTSTMPRAGRLWKVEYLSVERAGETLELTAACLDSVRGQSPEVLLSARFEVTLDAEGFGFIKLDLPDEWNLVRLEGPGAKPLFAAFLD